MFCGVVDIMVDKAYVIRRRVMRKRTELRINSMVE